MDTDTPTNATQDEAARDGRRSSTHQPPMLLGPTGRQGVEQCRHIRRPLPEATTDEGEDVTKLLKTPQERAWWVALHPAVVVGIALLRFGDVLSLHLVCARDDGPPTPSRPVAPECLQTLDFASIIRITAFSAEKKVRDHTAACPLRCASEVAWVDAGLEQSKGLGLS